ncbi:MAG: ATP-binding protein, partial [Cyanobacteria bacterium]|nr:ATP-binding protein [Cyanobacteriota bacterium]
MFATVYTGAIQGLDGRKIAVEVDLTSGIPGLTIVGLPDTAVNESKERVKSAVKNSGFEFPLKKVVINLAPADSKKEGTGFDLPLALGILLASETLQVTPFLEHACFIGEVSLEGSIRGINGVLAIAMMAKAEGFKYLVVPSENAQEASLVEGIEVFGLPHLKDLPVFLMHPYSYAKQVDKALLTAQMTQPRKNLPDFKDVKGQLQAKRALEIAAAGGHNMLMVGPPGSGKSLRAGSFPSILPPL